MYTQTGGSYHQSCKYSVGVWSSASLFIHRLRFSKLLFGFGKGINSNSTFKSIRILRIRVAETPLTPFHHFCAVETSIFARIFQITGSFFNVSNVGGYGGVNIAWRCVKLPGADWIMGLVGGGAYDGPRKVNYRYQIDRCGNNVTICILHIGR